MSNPIETETMNVSPDTLTTGETLSAPTKRTFAQPRAMQKRLIAERIVLVREQIENAQADAELGARLTERGMDETQLAHGLALQQAAATAFDVRQQAMGAQQLACATLEDAADAVRSAYGEFRANARHAYTTRAARTTLGLVGMISADTEQMMSQARASYAAALASPEFMDGLASYRYTTARIESLLQGVDALFAVLTAANQAKSDALQATRARDAAVAAMDSWHNRFKTAVRYATRGRPDLKARAGL